MISRLGVLSVFLKFRETKIKNQNRNNKIDKNGKTIVKKKKDKLVEHFGEFHILRFFHDLLIFDLTSTNIINK